MAQKKDDGIIIEVQAGRRLVKLCVDHTMKVTKREKMLASIAQKTHDLELLADLVQNKCYLIVLGCLMNPMFDLLCHDVQCAYPVFIGKAF